MSFFPPKQLFIRVINHMVTAALVFKEQRSNGSTWLLCYRLPSLI